METHSHGTAEAVRVEADERGWELHILGVDGWHIWNIHGEAEELIRQCAKIDNWLADQPWSRPPRVDAVEGHTLEDTQARILDEAIGRIWS